MDTSYLNVLQNGINNFLGSTGDWNSSISNPSSENIFNNTLERISSLFEIIGKAEEVLNAVSDFIIVWKKIEKYTEIINTLSSSLAGATDEQKANIRAEIAENRRKIEIAKKLLESNRQRISGAYEAAMSVKFPDLSSASFNENINITVNYVELADSSATLARLIGSGNIDTSKLSKDLSKYGLPDLSGLKSRIDSEVMKTEDQLRSITDKVYGYANSLAASEGVSVDYTLTYVAPEVPVVQQDDSVVLEKSANNGNNKGTTYVVQPGDSLSKIATQIYGDAGRYKDIYENNKDLIGSNPNMIKAGMVLTIPGVTKAVTESVEHVENLDENEPISSVESENIDKELKNTSKKVAEEKSVETKTTSKNDADIDPNSRRDTNGSKPVSTNTSKTSRGNTEPLSGFDYYVGKAPNGKSVVVSKAEYDALSPEQRVGIKSAFGITEGNPTYELTDAQMKTFYAVVASEAAANYDDALGVASVALNMTETEKQGQTLYDVITNKDGGNAFDAYGGTNYNDYMNNNIPIPEYVIDAVDNAMSGIRNTACNTFRSNGSSSFSNNMITSDGNRYAVYSSNLGLYKL